MESAFIPHEEASTLKQLGFDNECFGYYSESNRLVVKFGINKNQLKGYENFVTAPLYQQAFEWFRDKHNLHVSFKPFPSGYKFMIFINESESSGYTYLNDSYNEAKLSALRELIKIANKNQ